MPTVNDLIPSEAPLNLGVFGASTQRVVNWVKQYVADALAAQPTPIDPTIPALIQALDLINGEVIGTTATEKASAVLNVKNQLASIFSSVGFVDANIFRKMPSYLAALIRTPGVYIEDTNGDLWTAENWTALHTTEVAANFVVITSVRSFRIGLNLTQLPYCSNVEIKGLEKISVAADVWNYSRSALDATKAIIAFANPAELGKDENGVYSKARLLANLSSTNEYFETVQEMEENATRDTSYCYIVNSGGTTDGTGMHCYYWNNSSFVDLGARPVSQGSDPYKGAPAHLYCWKYKAFEGDTKQWHSPKHVINRDIYNNKTAFQACYKAVKGTNFTESYSWGVEQTTDAITAWRFYMSSGSLSSSSSFNKTSSYYVFPCTAFEEEI